MKQTFIAFLEELSSESQDAKAFIEAVVTGFKACFESSHMIYHADGDKLNTKLISNVSVEDKDDDDNGELINDLMRKWIRALSDNKFNKNFHREHIEFVLLSENPTLIIGSESGDKVPIRDHQMLGMIKDRVREMLNDPQNAYVKSPIVAKLKSMVFSARRANQPQKAAYYEDQINKLDPSISIEMKDIESKVKSQEKAKQDSMADMKDIADVVAKKMANKEEKSDQPDIKNLADLVAGKLSKEEISRKARLAGLNSLFK